MYRNLTDATEAVERLRIRHCADPEVARGIVAIWAGYVDWTDLEMRVGTESAVVAVAQNGPEQSDDPDGHGYSSFHHDYPPTLLKYMKANGNPLIDGIDWKIMSTQLDELLRPDDRPIVDGEESDRLMAIARDVLTSSPRIPAWLRVTDLRRNKRGEIAMGVVMRHRDGVREAFAEYDATSIDEEQHNDEDFIRAAARRYALDNVNDAAPAPVAAEAVAAGRADHRYGVELATARWSVERWGGEAREQLRAHIVRRLGDRNGDPDHDTFAHADLQEPDADNDFYPRLERYTVHLKDGVLRRAMRLAPGAVWDRAVHLNKELPGTIALALEGKPVEALIDHPLLAGRTLVRVHQWSGHAVAELDERLVTLDSIGIDERAWRAFVAPIRCAEAGTVEMAELDMEYGEDASGRLIDSAGVGGIYYALRDYGSRRRIEILTGSGKDFTDGDGPFATDCPARIIEAADPPSSENAFFWRLRCLGLSDRSDSGDSIYF